MDSLILLVPDADLSPLSLGLMGGVLFAAYVIRGVSGFGSSLAAVPLLAHFLPLTFIVPFMTLMDLVGSLVLSHSGWRQRQIRWLEIGWLLPATVIGLGVGIWLLKSLPEQALQIALGALVILFGLRAALGLGGHRIVRRLWALPAGFLGGLVDALFATGGPPFVIYIGHRLRDKGELRATLSALFLLTGLSRAAGFLLAGLFWQPAIGLALGVGVPLMLAGLYVGHRIHLRISRTQMMAAIGVLLVGSGISILLRGWAG